MLSHTKATAYLHYDVTTQYSSSKNVVGLVPQSNFPIKFIKLGQDLNFRIVTFSIAALGDIPKGIPAPALQDREVFLHSEFITPSPVPFSDLSLVYIVAGMYIFERDIPYSSTDFVSFRFNPLGPETQKLALDNSNFVNY